MLRTPRQPRLLVTDRPFLGREAVADGLLTPDDLRNRSWRRLFRGVYVHRSAPVTHELFLRAACLLLPDAVVSGCSAAVLWGVDLAGPDDDVEVTVPPQAHPVRIPGLRVRRAALPTEHRSLVRGIPVTSPEATAVRLAGLLPGDDGVVAVDQLVATRAARIDDVRALAAVVRGPGAARARRACALADGLAGSPPETRLRLRMARAGLPPPVAQHRVLDAQGRFVATVDFGWPALRIAVEYDGEWHAEPGQSGRDRGRLNRLREAGWTVVFVTAADMHDEERLVARIAAALGVRLCGSRALR